MPFNWLMICKLVSQVFVRWQCEERDLSINFVPNLVESECLISAIGDIWKSLLHKVIGNNAAAAAAAAAAAGFEG